jgi:hypothetical protein
MQLENSNKSFTKGVAQIELQLGKLTPKFFDEFGLKIASNNPFSNQATCFNL